MNASQPLKLTWKDVPTRTITAGGVEFAYRELGTDNPGTPWYSSFIWPPCWTIGILVSSTASPRNIA